MQTNGIVKLLINASRIKYTVLDELFTGVHVDDATVNFFIDASAVFYRMYRDDSISSIYANDSDVASMEMTIAIMNTMAHYRNYISTRLHRKNRVFFVVNRACPQYQSSKLSDYGDDYYQSLSTKDKRYGPLNSIIKKTLDHVQMIVPFFEDIFYIDCKGVEEFAAIEYLMRCPIAKNDFNIIFTRNETMYQMLSPSRIVLYPKRDGSRIVTSKDWTKAVVGNVKYTPGYLHPKFVLLYLAIRGLKCRGIPSRYIRGPVNTLKLLSKASECNVKSISVRTFLETMSEKEQYFRWPTDEDLSDMERIYTALNVDNAVAAITEAQTSRIESGTYNLYDQLGLQKLNEMLVQLDDILELRQLSYNTAR